MNRAEFVTAIEAELIGIFGSRELKHAQAQLNAKRLGARIATTFREENLWRWITRFVSNGSMLLKLRGPNDKIARSAFKEAGFLLELLSDTSDESDRDLARILSAISYDISGYQANSLFLMRGLAQYSVNAFSDDCNGELQTTDHVNPIFPFLQIFLAKKIPLASTVTISKDDLFLIHLEKALKGFCTHILRGGTYEFVDDLESLYLASFSQRSYLLNLSLLLLSVRARTYKEKSIWAAVSSAGKLGDEAWIRYVRLKTNDLYIGNRVKPISERRSKFELWESQLAAIKAGIISTSESFAVQMPTSAGKTLIGELSVFDSLRREIGSKCLYIAPFRALANQIEEDLRDALSPLGYSVSTLSGSFELDPFDDVVISETDVLVCTPEKVDMLTRVRADYFNSLSAIVVDEGHIVGDIERGPQFELLLARIRRLFPALRIVFISAVMPEENAKQISKWLASSEDNLIQSPLQDDGKPWQPTRKVFGFFWWDGDTSQIDFPEIEVGQTPAGISIPAFARGIADRRAISYLTPKRRAKKIKPFPDDTGNKGQTCAVLAYEFASKGPTLVFTPRPDWVLSTANRLLDLIEGLELGGEQINSCFAEQHDLASWNAAEEWYGPTSIQCRLLKRRIGFHHGQLPDSLRKAIEDDYRSGRLSVLFANSTVSQGINFPIKYLIVHSLVLRAEEGQEIEHVSIRDFWNLVGRAGRAGRETEGQIIFVALKASDRTKYKEFIDQSKIEPVESVFVQLARKFLEDKVSCPGSIDTVGRVI